MAIDPILPKIAAPTVASTPETKVAGFGGNFAERLDNAIAGVSGQLNEADVRLSRVASGDDADLHGTMIALQEADISLRLMVSVRDKAVEAYEKILNMQV